MKETFPAHPCSVIPTLGLDFSFSASVSVCLWSLLVPGFLVSAVWLSVLGIQTHKVRYLGNEIWESYYDGKKKCLDCTATGL